MTPVARTISGVGFVDAEHPQQSNFTEDQATSDPETPEPVALDGTYNNTKPFHRLRDS